MSLNWKGEKVPGPNRDFIEMRAAIWNSKTRLGLHGKLLIGSCWGRDVAHEITAHGSPKDRKAKRSEESAKRTGKELKVCHVIDPRFRLISTPRAPMRQPPSIAVRPIEASKPF